MSKLLPYEVGLSIIMSLGLYLLDKCGKTSALLNIGFLAIIGAVLIHMAMQIPWIWSPPGAMRIWRVALVICIVIFVVTWFGIWTWPTQTKSDVPTNTPKPGSFTSMFTIKNAEDCEIEGGTFLGADTFLKGENVKGLKVQSPFFASTEVVSQAMALARQKARENSQFEGTFKSIFWAKTNKSLAEGETRDGTLINVSVLIRKIGKLKTIEGFPMEFKSGSIHATLRPLIIKGRLTLPNHIDHTIACSISEEDTMLHQAMEPITTDGILGELPYFLPGVDYQTLDQAELTISFRDESGSIYDIKYACSPNGASQP